MFSKLCSISGCALFLAIVHLTGATQHHEQSCLSGKDVASILGRWIAIFENRRPAALAAIVNATVTEDVVAYDDGINFLFGTPAGGSTGPYATSRAEFFDSVAPESPLVYDRHFESTSIEHNCRSITYRWEASALTKGPSPAAPDIRAKPNTLVKFRGTDLLRVDLCSGLIERVDSSGDYLNFLYAAGLPVGFALGSKPGRAKVDVNYPAAGYGI